MDRDSWAEPRIRTVLTAVKGSVMVNTTFQPFSSHDYAVFHFTDIHHLANDCIGSIVWEPMPGDLACIIFTSGSTGKPKGVMIPHRAIVNYATTSPFNMNVRPKDRVLHILSVAFDASTGMLFSIIAGAGTIVPASKHTMMAEALSCSIWTATPSILASFLPPSGESSQPKVTTSYPRLHTVLLGEELIPSELLDAWCSPRRKILNAYGPTESTVASLMHVIGYHEYSQNRNHSIVGKPMKNGPVRLVNADLEELTEDGQEGEIVIGGMGLADGYFQDAEKTEKAFIDWKGSRLYRTGDYGRWKRDSRGDRVIEFRGRKDRVIKNRGFLVNLDADIQAPMVTLGFGIRAAYVTVFRKKIVALVYPNTVDPAAVRNAMIASFSSFMVPDRILAVQQLPMTANGKVDPKAALQLIESQETDGLPLINGHTVTDTHDESECPDERKWRIIEQSVRKTLALTKGSTIESESNLFSLGASSLEIMTFVSHCQTNNLQILLRDVYRLPNLRSICDTAKMVGKQLGKDGEDTHGSTRRSVSQAMMASSRGPSSIRTTGDVVAPMTPLQLELAQPTMQVNGKNTNQVRLRYALKHAQVLESSWRQVWTFEPIFRTQFHMENGIGLQVIREEPLASPVTVRVSSRTAYQESLDGENTHVGLGARLKIVIHEPREARDKEGEVTVIFTAHHSLVDGSSMAAILSKVEAVAAGQQPRLNPPFTTAAWALIERQKMQDEMAKDFWNNRLRDVPPIENLGLPKPHAGAVEAAGEIQFQLPLPAEDLRRCASENKVTVAALYYTAWAMVVSKYTDRDMVTVGAVLSGQETPHVTETAIGPLIATVPLVFRFGSESSVGQVLQNTHRELHELADMSWSSPQQINHRVCTLVALQYDLPKYQVTIPRLGYSAFEDSAFPLSLLVEDGGIFRLVFDPAVYTADDVRDISLRLQLGLRALSECTDIQACLDRVMSDEEQRRVLREWNHPFELPDDSQGSTLQTAFERSVSKHADLPALEISDTTLTYRELNDMANKVAIKLCRDFPPTRPIAIHADGSIEWIVGILGIVKAGRPYCPLDPQYSFERRKAVCVSANASGVLFPNAEQASKNPCQEGISLIIEDILQLQPPPAKNVCVNVDPCSDAIMLFTSGTTGVPKGVPVSHRGLLTLQSNPEAAMFSGPGKRIAQMMSPAFDVCANEIFSALLYGGTLVLRDPDDPYRHLKVVDTATLTPSVIGALDPTEHKNLRIVYSTGEAATPGLINQWEPGRDFYNAYGPTEWSVWVSVTRMKAGEPITIGRAVRGARMYVLDRHMRHQPIGALGELYLAGHLLARGYTNSEEQTKSRFLSDPWFPGQRMYKTGDLCRWTRDGQVSYVGRRDRQVKVRGFRVELPSVEQQIYAAEPRITLAAVLCINDALVAVVEPGTVDTASVKETLAKRLPPAWVPQRWVATSRMPVNANQKIDMKTLQVMLTEGEDVPTSPKEVQPDHVAEGVAQEWRGLLKLEPGRILRPCDSFLNLGGHSILQMLLSARLASRFKIPVFLKDIIHRDGFLDQVGLIKSRQCAQEEEKNDCQTCGPLNGQVSSVENFQFLQYSVATSSSTFNIPLFLRLTGGFCRRSLVNAINTVLANHEIFRSNYTRDDTGCTRRELRPDAPRACELPIPNIKSEINRPFDTSHDELIRVHFWDDNVLIIASHMIADLSSLQNFFAEVSSVFTNQTPSKQTITDYMSLGRWSRSVQPEDRNFWINYLRGAPGEVRIDKLPSSSRFNGTSKIVTIPGNLSKRLVHLTRSSSLTRHHIALGVVALAMNKVTNCNDIVLGAPLSGRVDEAEQRSMGPMLDRLPIRIDKLGGHGTTAGFLDYVRKSSQAALAAAIPFSQLLDVLGTDLTSITHPVFEVMVTFHLNQGPSGYLDIPDCRVLSVPVHASGAKFLLMFEWTEYSETEWIVRIEYDSDRLSKKTIASIADAIGIVFEGFVQYWEFGESNSPPDLGDCKDAAILVQA